MQQTIYAAFALLAALGAGDFAAVDESRETPTRFEYTQVHMGTRFRILLYAGSEGVANRAATAAMDRIAALDKALSDYKQDSELSLLGAASPTAKPVPLSDDLWNVLAYSQKLADRTEGAFDVTLGPYSRLWRRARRRKELPPKDLLQKAGHSVGYKKLILDHCRQTATLTSEKMRLDLGAIAKGYAADEALIVLRDRGIESALIDAAGDIVTTGPPPGKSGWKVTVANLSNAEAPTEKQGRVPQEHPEKSAPNESATGSRLVIKDAAVATSGDLYQHLEIDGRRYSHIIDPFSGIGLAGQTSVTIIAPDGMTADSLASAISVLGVDKGLALVRDMPGVACRFTWIDSDGKTSVRQTETFLPYMATSDPDEK